MVNQQGILAYIEKKNKKKRMVRQIIKRASIVNTTFLSTYF